MAKIVALDAIDIRFPTSQSRIGSDAMNHDPDYSAVYVTLRSDDPSAPAGHALVFTIGRGNEVQVAAVRALTELVVGRDVDALLNGLGAFARSLAGDSQLRWLGPEKGVMQMAIGGVVNAAWDMAARRAGLPLWRFIAELPPERIVDAIDFRYLADALTPGEALAILRRMEPRREARIAELSERGYPAYTTSPGWPSRTGSGPSSSRSASTSRTTCAACVSRAKRSATASRSRWTPTSAGTRHRRSTGFKDSHRSIRLGSRNPPAPTTCWHTPRSGARSRRYRSRPASIPTTG